jgi:hypothetical protein
MKIASFLGWLNPSSTGNKPQRPQPAAVKRSNPNFAYFRYAIPVAAIAASTTMFLTAKLSSRVDWGWVGFMAVAASGTYVGVRCLEDTPGSSESVIYLRKALDSAAVLQSELSVQLRVSRETQADLAKKLSIVNATLIASQVEARETRSSVAELQDYLVSLTSQNQGQHQADSRTAQTGPPVATTSVISAHRDLLACDPLIDNSVTEDAW